MKIVNSTVFQGKEVLWATVPIKSRPREFDIISAANAAEHLIIEHSGFALEPRKQYVPNELIEAIDKHLSDSKPLFVKDGLKFYAGALLKKYGLWVEFPKTGKRDLRSQCYYQIRFEICSDCQR